jgi:integrase
VKGDAVAVRTTKTGSQVWCPLPAIALTALAESPSANERYVFWNGRCLPTSAVKIWERTFVRVFELAEIPPDKRFIHNFRHSFATDLLARGIPIEDVSTLLGNFGENRRETLLAPREIPQRPDRGTGADAVGNKGVTTHR